MQLSTMRHCIEFILLIYFLSVKDASAGPFAYYQPPQDVEPGSVTPLTPIDNAGEPVRRIATHKAISSQKTPVALSKHHADHTKHHADLSHKKHPVDSAVNLEKSKRTMEKHDDEKLEQRTDDTNSRVARNADSAQIPLGLIKLYNTNRKRRCLKCGHHTHPPRNHEEGVLIPIDESHHGHHTGHDHHHAFAPHVGYEREKRHVEHGDHHLASRDGTHEHHADEHHNHHQRKHVHKRSVHYVPVDVINPPRPTSTEYSYIRIKPNNNYGPVDIINPPRPTPRVIEPTYVKPHPNYESIDVINPSSPTPRVVGSTYVKPRSALHKRSVRCISCTARVKSANKYNENVPLEFRKNQETE